MTKKELKARCKELGIDTKGLDTNPKLEAAIEAKEAELAKEKKAPQPPKGEQDSAEQAKQNSEKAEAEKAEAEKAEAEKAEAEKAEAEKASKKSSKNKKAAKAAKPVEKFYEDDRGRKWGFKKNAPKKIRIDGHPMTQEEILDTEEVVSELVYGNCSFLTQIRK